MPIHSTAIVSPRAEIDPTADIGAYAVVEAHVHIGPNVTLMPHAFVGRGTTLSAGVKVHPYAVVGHEPQDLKYAGAPSFTEVGENTVIREGATVHRGTEPDSRTVVGKNCLIMSAAHVGHNCSLADHVIVANCGLVSGHITVGTRAFISGCVVIHQFSRIGEFAMLGGGIRVPKDVPPFMLVGPQGPVGVNVVGLRRAGFSSTERLEIRQCYHLLYRTETFFPRAVEKIEALVKTDPGRRLLEFLRAPSKRGYLRFKKSGAGGAAAGEGDEG